VLTVFVISKVDHKVISMERGAWGVEPGAWSLEHGADEK
jgi:hypothetical protein